MESVSKVTDKQGEALIDIAWNAAEELGCSVLIRMDEEGYYHLIFPSPEEDDNGNGKF